MKIYKKLIGMIVMAAMVVGTFGIHAAAAKKITSVSLKVTANILVGSQIDSDAVEVTTRNSRYFVDSYEFTNSGFSWSADDIPEMEIELYAEDDYYFALKAGDVKLSGANYVSARTKDSSKVLVVKVKLPSLAEQAGLIETAYWTGSAIAGWDEAVGTGTYEVKLYKDGKNIGGTKTTTACSYNFSTEMGEAGNYTFQVRPINKINPDNKGEWKEGPGQYINAEVAQQLKNGNAAWHQDQTGWWYRNLDGSYASNGWHLIGDKWYYFDAAGYMQTGWINWNGADYYCDLVNGDMWASKETPDGNHVGADGVKIDAETWQKMQEQAQREAEEAVNWDEWNKQWDDKED